MKNQLKTLALLGGLSVLLVGAGTLVGGTGNLVVFGAIAVALNFFSYFFSDKVVLAMNRAREVSPREAPRLHAIVQDVAERAGIPKPRVFIMEDDSPNAFATGRNPQHGVVAVTTGIMNILSERELRGVIAHEIAHIKNRDILIASVAAMIATAISIIASVARWAAIFGGPRDDDEGGNPIALIAFAIVAPIAATIVQLAISRAREYHADATGARFIGDPEALARALEKLDLASRRIPLHAAEAAPATASLFIVNPLSGQSMLRWFSTHPPLPERIRRLRAMAG
ncbi:MAG: protease HtpX [Deltaproteobacteria bacterium]|nr:MAG: protease HtpX [Deltaproteobacteria bacterium]